MQTTVCPPIVNSIATTRAISSPEYAGFSSGSGRALDPEVAQLAVERRPPDPQPPRDFGHPPAIVADGEADDVGLDVLQRAQVAVGGVEHHAHALLDHRIVLLAVT